jgi:hypothetical protein
VLGALPVTVAAPAACCGLLGLHMLGCLLTDAYARSVASPLCTYPRCGLRLGGDARCTLRCLLSDTSSITGCATPV